MSMGVSIKKDKVQEYLDCFKNHKPLPVPITVEDLFMLMGTSMAILLSDSVALVELTGRTDMPAHPEYQEAVAAQIRREIHGATELVCKMAGEVSSGAYDQSFEPAFLAEIVVNEMGRTTVTPISGVKPRPQELN